MHYHMIGRFFLNSPGHCYSFRATAELLFMCQEADQDLDKDLSQEEKFCLAIEKAILIGLVR